MLHYQNLHPPFKYAILKRRILLRGWCHLEKEELLNELLVMLFNEVLDMEHKALINGSFKEISINDMHIINAIGIQEARNKSAVAKTKSDTVGTLTTAINNLVKKC